MDKQLKDLMERLGHAINDSVSDSDSIAEAIGEIKREGYDVYLVLQATIGFNKRDQDANDDGELEGAAVSAADTEFTEQDEAFLKALKIRMEE